MIMAQERLIRKTQIRLEEMAAFVQQAAENGRPIDEVERGLPEASVVRSSSAATVLLFP